MPSREELLQSIRPGAQLDKNFFLRIYGYDITTPGFADQALSRMEILGCSKAREYYSCIKVENEVRYEQQMKAVSAQYVADLESKWKRKEVSKDAAGFRKTRYQFAGFPEDW